MNLNYLIRKQLAGWQQKAYINSQPFYFFNLFRRNLLLITLIILYSESFSQNYENKENTSKKVELSLEGMVAASAGKEFYAFNVGGPALI